MFKHYTHTYTLLLKSSLEGESSAGEASSAIEKLMKEKPMNIVDFLRLYKQLEKELAERKSKGETKDELLTFNLQIQALKNDVRAVLNAGVKVPENFTEGKQQILELLTILYGREQAEKIIPDNTFFEKSDPKNFTATAKDEDKTYWKAPKEFIFAFDTNNKDYLYIYRNHGDKGVSQVGRIYIDPKAFNPTWYLREGFAEETGDHSIIANYVTVSRDGKRNGTNIWHPKVAYGNSSSKDTIDLVNTRAVPELKEKSKELESLILTPLPQKRIFAKYKEGDSTDVRSLPSYTFVSNLQKYTIIKDKVTELQKLTDLSGNLGGETIVERNKKIENALKEIHDYNEALQNFIEKTAESPLYALDDWEIDLDTGIINLANTKLFPLEKGITFTDMDTKREDKKYYLVQAYIYGKPHKFAISYGGEFIFEYNEKANNWKKMFTGEEEEEITSDKVKLSGKEIMEAYIKQLKAKEVESTIEPSEQENRKNTLFNQLTSIDSTGVKETGLAINSKQFEVIIDSFNNLHRTKGFESEKFKEQFKEILIPMVAYEMIVVLKGQSGTLKIVKKEDGSMSISLGGGKEYSIPKSFITSLESIGIDKRELKELLEEKLAKNAQKTPDKILDSEKFKIFFQQISDKDAKEGFESVKTQLQLNSITVAGIPNEIVTFLKTRTDRLALIEVIKPILGYKSGKEKNSYEEAIKELLNMNQTLTTEMIDTQVVNNLLTKLPLTKKNSSPTIKKGDRIGTYLDIDFYIGEVGIPFTIYQKGSGSSSMTPSLTFDSEKITGTLPHSRGIGIGYTETEITLKTDNGTLENYVTLMKEAQKVYTSRKISIPNLNNIFYYINDNPSFEKNVSFIIQLFEKTFEKTKDKLKLTRGEIDKIQTSAPYKKDIITYYLKD